MTRQGRAAASSEHPQTIIQAYRELADPELRDSCRCQFDRQGQTVDATANVSDDRHISVRQREGFQVRTHSFGKELNRGESQRRAGRYRRRGWRQFQGSQA